MQAKAAICKIANMEKSVCRNYHSTAKTKLHNEVIQILNYSTDSCCCYYSNPFFHAPIVTCIVVV